jgi:hypothetical protein
LSFFFVFFLFGECDFLTVTKKKKRKKLSGNARQPVRWDCVGAFLGAVEAGERTATVITFTIIASREENEKSHSR